MAASVSAPASVRSEAKLPASINPAPSAMRHSSEFAANAIIATAVRVAVCALGKAHPLARETARK
jgi:hypothetical protein